MVQAAIAKGSPLPATTITTTAIAEAKAWAANATAPQKRGSLGRRRLVQEDKIARLGRKLVAEGEFQSACIPIVFHGVSAVPLFGTCSWCALRQCIAYVEPLHGVRRASDMAVCCGCQVRMGFASVWCTLCSCGWAYTNNVA
jgi:hypothetical protein